MSLKNKSFDFVILGSGPAGSTIANFLSSNFSIAMVDSAVKKKNNLKIYPSKPFFLNSHPNFYTAQYSNVFGGNSELWSNKVYLIHPNETKNWPIEHKEILSFSKDLAQKIKLDHDRIFKPKKHNDNSFFHKSYRPKINNIFEFYEISKKTNIKIFQQCTINKIINFNNKVKKIQIINNIGNIETIEINKGLILACGGLGNSAIFMNLFKSYSKKIMHTFSDHCHFNVGKLSSILNKNLLKDYLKKKSHYEDCLVIEKNKIFCGIQIDSPKIYSQYFRRLAINSKKNYFKYLFNFLHKILSHASKYSYFNKYSLELFFNDKSDKNSIMLSSNKKDFFGNNKINIDYTLNDEFYDFSKNNIPNYFSRIQNINKRDFNEKNVYVGIHPSCSTPITKNKHDYTVDLNCKIRPFTNIFTIGSNIFPTNGITNPTWTIMTFAYRLANHLNKFNFQ